MVTVTAGRAVGQHLFDLKEGQKAAAFAVLGDSGIDTPGEIVADYTLEAFLVLDNDSGQGALVPQLAAEPEFGKSHWRLQGRLEVRENVEHKDELLRHWGGDLYQVPALQEWTEDVPQRDDDAKFHRAFVFDAGLNAYVGQLDQSVYVHGLDRNRNIFWSLRVGCHRKLTPMTFRGCKAEAYHKAHFGTPGYDGSEHIRLNAEDIAYMEVQEAKIDREFIPKHTAAATRQLLSALRRQSDEPELTVTHYGSDGMHGPLDFHIQLTYRGQPVPDAPVRFDVTGQHKCLGDEFLVWDSPTRKWREVTRNKIFGVRWDLAPRTDAQGQVVLRFRGHFWGIRNLQPLPATICLEAEAASIPGKPLRKAQAVAVLKHTLFARTVYYSEGSITWPEVEPGHRIKKVTHGQWVNPANSAHDLWRIYGLITLGYDKPFVPPRTKDGFFWLPLEPNTILQIDPHRRVDNPSTARDPRKPNAPLRHPLAGYATSLDVDDAFWKMPAGSGVGLEVEWIDGTAGLFFVHREEKQNGLFVLLSPSVSTMTGDRNILFIQQEAEQEAVEYVVKKVLRKAVTGSNPVGTAVEVGIMAYDVADLTFDIAKAIAMNTGTPYELPKGGTFIRLRSEIGCLRNDDGKTSTLYCLSGSPAVFTPDGRAIEAKPGEAIRFDVGGAVQPPVAAEMPSVLRDALAALNDPPPPHGGPDALAPTAEAVPSRPSESVPGASGGPPADARSTPERARTRTWVAGIVATLLVLASLGVVAIRKARYGERQ